MTDTLQVLGQSFPNPTTLTTLYTVPSATSSMVSSIMICNQGPEEDWFNISVAIGGSADSPKQYIYSQLYLDANDTFIATVGVSMAASDVLRCYSTNGYCSFSAFGVQIT